MSQALQTAELPEEALAFVKAGTPTPKVESAALTPSSSAPAPAPEKTVELAAFRKDAIPLPTAPAAAPESKMPLAPGTAAEAPPSTEKSAPVAAPKPKTPAKVAVQEPEATSVLSGGVVSMTFRLPAEIPAGLVQASADRKIKKVRPYTQQEIVAEAISQWLKKNGYSKS